MKDAIIELYEGNLGGGKSYSCVKRAYNLLLDGWVVQTNITLKWDNIKARAYNEGYKLDDKQYVHLDGEVIKNFYDHVAGGGKTLLILDEAHLWFDQHSFKENQKMITRILTQTRKLQLHILLITQDRNNIAVTFRRMIQYIWVCRDFQKHKIIGFTPPLPVMLQICVQRDTNNVIERKWIVKDKKVFDLYDSKELLQDVKLGMERPDIKVEKIQKPPSKFKGFLKYAAILGLAYLISTRGNSNSEIPETENEPDKIIPGPVAYEVPDEKTYYAGMYILNGIHHIYHCNYQEWIPVVVKKFEQGRKLILKDGTELYYIRSKPGHETWKGVGLPTRQETVSVDRPVEVDSTVDDAL
jgi:hypothetical protein